MQIILTISDASSATEDGNCSALRSLIREEGHNHAQRGRDRQCTSNSTESTEDEQSNFLSHEAASQVSQSKDHCARHERRLGRVNIRYPAALHGVFSTIMGLGG